MYVSNIFHSEPGSIFAGILLEEELCRLRMKIINDQLVTSIELQFNGHIKLFVEKASINSLPIYCTDNRSYA